MPKPPVAVLSLFVAVTSAGSLPGQVVPPKAPAQSATKPAARAAVSHAVTHRKVDGRVRIEVDGALFTESFHRNQPFPVLYPVLGPGGVAMTRSFPLAKGGPDEAKDHPHHRSLWFTHGAIGGHDFWAGKGRIEPVAEEVEAIEVDGRPAVRLRSQNRYVAGGKTICTDRRTLVFFASPAGRFIDYEIALGARDRDVVFGDTKEGSMAIRLAPSLRVRGKAATGTLRNADGVVGKRVWGKRSDWIDNYGRVGTSTVGVAIFDHPGNHGHPCRWHARDYGLLAANPFGIHHFERAPKGTGDFLLEKGKRLRLRYRFFFHRGTTAAAAVGGQYARFARSPSRAAAPATKKAAGPKKPDGKRKNFP